MTDVFSVKNEEGVDLGRSSEYPSTDRKGRYINSASHSHEVQTLDDPPEVKSAPGS